MSWQPTPAELIAQEKALIGELLGLSDPEHITFNDVGWDSRVYLVGAGQFVFKFPRSETVRRQYGAEVAACQMAATCASPVLVPRVRWQHPQCDYVGFEGVVGASLSDVVTQLDAVAKTRIGYALGLFLRQWHACALPEIRASDAETEIAETHHQYELGRSLLQECLTAAEQAALQYLVQEELPAALQTAREPLVLCHGDLGYWNIVYGAQSQVGVIDFGDVCYGAPARDFIGLDDPLILDAALSAYGDIPGLRAHIALRKRVLPVLELPFYIAKGDQISIEKAVLKLKASLAL